MKYMKKAGIYKGSNVTFDSEKIEARSYGWWLFVCKINGKVIFNHANYSVSTGRHQSKMDYLLAELGVKIDLSLAYTQCSLENVPHALLDEIESGRKAIAKIQKEIDKPRSMKKTNIKRTESIKRIRNHLKQVRRFWKEQNENA